MKQDAVKGFTLYTRITKENERIIKRIAELRHLNVSSLTRQYIMKEVEKDPLFPQIKKEIEAEQAI